MELFHLPGDFGDVMAVICAAATSRTSEKGNDIFGINGAPRWSMLRWNYNKKYLETLIRSKCKELQDSSVQGNPRQSWILDSTPWTPDSRNWIPHSFSVELGFRIPIVSGIPDSKAQDSRFHNKNLLDDWIQTPIYGASRSVLTSSPGPGRFSQRPGDEFGSVS